MNSTSMFTNTVIKFPHSIFVRTLGKVLGKQQVHRIQDKVIKIIQLDIAPMRSLFIIDIKVKYIQRVCILISKCARDILELN